MAADNVFQDAAESGELISMEVPGSNSPRLFQVIEIDSVGAVPRYYQFQARPDACGLCHKDPAAGYAAVGDIRYCHGDDDASPTCYMRATNPLYVTPGLVVELP